MQTWSEEFQARIYPDTLESNFQDMFAVVCVSDGVDADLFKPPTDSERTSIRAKLGIPVELTVPVIA
ncbi:MAG: hypothetical protein ACR2IB_07310 [Pyrinomonadaceae bacterium]